LGKKKSREKSVKLPASLDENLRIEKRLPLSLPIAKARDFYEV